MQARNREQTWARTGTTSDLRHEQEQGDHQWLWGTTPDRKVRSQWFECFLYCRWCWDLSRLPVLCYLQLGTVLPSWILWRKFCETSNSTAKSTIYRTFALNKILTKTSVWPSVHVFCGCSKLLESLRKELSLGAGKWHSLQANFTQCLLSTHPHRVQVLVTHLRARRFWIYLEIQVSELLSRLRRAAKAATSSAQMSTMQGAGIYPTPFVLPSSWSDPYSQISRQNYHTPFLHTGVFRGPAGIQMESSKHGPLVQANWTCQRTALASGRHLAHCGSSRGTPPTHSPLHQGL